MSLVANTTHVDQGLAHLLGQFRSATQLRMLLKILLTQVQAIETDAQALAAGLNVTSATNYQLDIIGDIVGEPRNGRTDAQYRPRILARIGINISNGHPDEILQIMTSIIGTSVNLSEYSSASFDLYVVVPDPSVLADAAAILSQLRPAGVRGTITYNSTLPPFQYDNVSGAGYDASGGHYASTLVS